MTIFTSRWLTWEPPEALDVGGAKSAESPRTVPETLRVGSAKGAKRGFGTSGTAHPTRSQGNEADPTIPEEWKAAVAKLRQMERPAHIAPDRWREVLADADRLLGWWQTLLPLEWSVEDLFGRETTDHQSVVWRVRGRKIGPAGSIAITLHGSAGETEWVFRRT